MPGQLENKEAPVLLGHGTSNGAAPDALRAIEVPYQKEEARAWWTEPVLTVPRRLSVNLAGVSGTCTATLGQQGGGHYCPPWCWPQCSQSHLAGVLAGIELAQVTS